MSRRAVLSLRLRLEGSEGSWQCVMDHCDGDENDVVLMRHGFSDAESRFFMVSMNKLMIMNCIVFANIKSKSSFHC